MKKGSGRASMVFSGLFFIAIMAVFIFALFQVGTLQQIVKNAETEKPTEISPERGHWLKTVKDNNYKPASLIIPKAVNKSQTSRASELYLEKAREALNKTTDSLNIMYVWTDDEKLNVISVTSFNKATKQAAIVVIPLYTVVNCGDVVNLNENYMTIEALYKIYGREYLRQFLEKKLQVSIPDYIHVNQSALKKLSDIMGLLNINGEKITMLDAFEQTASGLRNDDKNIVRAVAAKILKPGIVFDLPTIIGIFTHDINTNLSPQEMLKIFYFSRKMNLTQMQKGTLPGYEYLNNNQKRLFVSDQTWKNIIFDITNVSSI